MRSSMVPVWALLLAPGTHERLILLFAFPMLFLFFVGEKRQNSEEIQTSRAFQLFNALRVRFITRRYVIEVSHGS
jgi:hypothetical protein